jgi:Protein of unknown function (DUF1569)
MKTLGDVQCRKEISERLGLVAAESPRRWGRMTAHQMICHLADSFRGVTGEKPFATRAGTAFGGLMKFGALYLPLKWPHGLGTMPEVDQEIAGTPPAEFGGDVRELRRLLEKFTRQPKEFAWAAHPVFGVMADPEWMRWGYLHMDHHFRQFGV